MKSVRVVVQGGGENREECIHIKIKMNEYVAPRVSDERRIARAVDVWRIKAKERV